MPVQEEGIKMMFSNYFILCLKSQGKILREASDVVQIPFGVEFSVFMKNLNTVRAVVKVEIDGADVLNGRKLIVNANSSLDLERFLTDNTLEGRRFKFIERTAAIEEYRGVRSEDGIVRVSFRYEKPNYHGLYGYSGPINPPMYIKGSINSSGQHTNHGSKTSRGPGGSGSSSGMLLNTAIGCNSLRAQSDAGITVEGSKSTQQFHSSSVGALESMEYVLVLKLSGFNGENKQVESPVLVSTKKICSSCGSKYSSKAEYCSKDGTYLRPSM